jgi:heterodisulfide reductase subunit C2
MPIIISKEKKENELLNSVRELSGVDISGCLQCKKCSNGCPMVTMVKVPPSEIIRRLQLNGNDSVLNCDLIWMCASCETCFTRCPMNIDMGAVMDAMRIISLRKNAAKHKGHVAFFNKMFLKTVKMFGRTYDLGMIAAYKIGTSNYVQDTEKFPMMLRKKKIALLPSLKADRKFVRNIFKNLPRV